MESMRTGGAAPKKTLAETGRAVRFERAVSVSHLTFNDGQRSGITSWVQTDYRHAYVGRLLRFGVLSISP